jgi:PAS domain-containing protein
VSISRRDISEPTAAEPQPCDGNAPDPTALSDHQLRTIIDTIPILAWRASPDGAAEFFNQRWRDYTGLSADEARGWA